MRECPNSRHNIKKSQQQCELDWQALQEALAVLAAHGEHTTEEYRVARHRIGGVRQTLNNMVMWVNIQQALEMGETVDVLLSGLWGVIDYVDQCGGGVEDIGRKIEEQKQ
jgi:hypothetical protein